MKTNITIGLAAALLTLTAVSCTDLDVDVKSKYTEYPNSPKALEAMEANVYYAFRGPLGRRYNEAQALSSDEEVGISFDGDYYDSGNYAHATLHHFMPGDACIGYLADLGTGITNCNTYLEAMGTNAADSVTAPVRAMRAFYHFIMMDSYGDAPILDKLPSGAVERKPRAEVAKWIESELLDVIPHLTTNVDATTYGKPTRYMAEALLAKLYINWAVYTASDVTAYEPTDKNEKLNDCVKLCDDIIKSGQFSLGGGANGWRSKFYPDNGAQIKDFIYAMPYQCLTETGMTYARFRTWRKADGGGEDGKTTYYGDPKSKSFGGNISLTPECSDLFTLKGDARNAAILKDTIYQYDPSTKQPVKKWSYKGNVVVLQKNITLKTNDGTLNVGSDVNGFSQGYKSIKFWLTNDDYKNNRNQSNDVPIFRYADILLTKAEAITRGATATNGDTPMSLFNQIRSYAGAPLLTQNPSLKDILDERGREFLNENWRRNDMIRFGTFESEYGLHKKSVSGAVFDKTRRIFPIPTDILKLNTNWKQNNGYE